jgi:hypothetical protein
MLVWCSRAAARLAAKPLRSHPVAAHALRQDLERHPASQRDLLGFVHDPHSAPADLTEDLIVADLCERRAPGPGIFGHLFDILFLPGSLDLLYPDHRREQLADLFGELWVAVNIFLERGPLAAPEAIRKFLGQMVEQVILFRFRARHRVESLEASRHRGRDRLHQKGSSTCERAGGEGEVQHQGLKLRMPSDGVKGLIALDPPPISVASHDQAL